MNSDIRDTLKFDLSEATGEEAERSAKKEQKRQKKMLRKQELMESNRLAEEEDMLARRREMRKLGGKQSLISGTTPTGSLLS